MDQDQDDTTNGSGNAVLQSNTDLSQDAPVQDGRDSVEPSEVVPTTIAEQGVDPGEVVAGDDEIMEHVDEGEQGVV